MIRGKIPERPAAPPKPAVPAAVIILRVSKRTIPKSEPFLCESWSNEQLDRPNALVKPTEFQFWFVTSPGSEVTVLQPNTTYDFEVMVGTNGQSGALPAPGLGGDLCRDTFKALYTAAGHPDAVLTDEFTFSAKTGGAFEDHFKLDLGLITTQRARYTSAVSAVHLYSIPVDRGADLKDDGLTRLQEFRSRLSLMGGLAVVKFEGRGTVDKPRDLGAFVAGFGFRAPFYGYCMIPRRNTLPARLCQTRGRKWLQPMRLNAGWIFLKQADANPAIVDSHRFVDAFVGLSFDTEIRTLLGPLANIFK